LGATHYLTKPADVDEVIASFDRKVAEDESGLEADTEGEPQTPSLARVEWEHIQRVLTDCGGNITKAAERLGIHRRSLQRKLSKFPTQR
jgi:two-component system response regulator RegA